MKPESTDSSLEFIISQALDFVDLNSSTWASGGPEGQITESKELSDGRTIRAKVTHGQSADIDTKEAAPSPEEVRPLVERLLETGKSFTVVSGSSDDTLEVTFFLE